MIEALRTTLNLCGIGETQSKITKQLATLEMFRDLDQKSLERIGQLGTIVRIPAGQTIMHEGRRGLEFVAIVDGEVTVTSAGHEVATLGSGQFVGEVALLDGEPRNATVTTTTPTTVLAMTAREFHTALADFPSVYDTVRNRADERRGMLSVA